GRPAATSGAVAYQVPFVERQGRGRARLPGPLPARPDLRKTGGPGRCSARVPVGAETGQGLPRGPRGAGTRGSRHLREIKLLALNKSQYLESRACVTSVACCL